MFGYTDPVMTKSMAECAGAGISLLTKEKDFIAKYMAQDIYPVVTCTLHDQDTTL